MRVEQIPVKTAKYMRAPVLVSEPWSAFYWRRY